MASSAVEWRTKPEEPILKAVEQAQDILARYGASGERICEGTINELPDVLDNEKVVEAV